MKRICLFLILFLLCGCSAPEVPPTETQAAPVLTAEPWDSEGIVSELVLQIPGGNTYSECMGFRGDVLLWSVDGHQEGRQVLEFCLIDPASKTITATREVTMPNPVTPQIYGDSLYLCDSRTGTVLELDRKLETTGEWTVPASTEESAVWYAANRKLWEFVGDQPLRCLFLGDVYWSEGEAQWTEVRRPYGRVDQHRLSGAIVDFSFRNGDDRLYYALDLTEGTVLTPPQGYERYYRTGNVWLCAGGKGQERYGIRVGTSAVRKISPTDGTLSLLPEGYILERSPDDHYLRLYDREGHCISVCCLWESQDGYAETLIWNDALGGYLIHYRPHSGGSRLLFWDIRKGSGTGTDLKLRPIPAAEGVQDALRAEAEALGERFGITIAVGTDCDLEQADQYIMGNCTYAEDFDLVCGALDILEGALEQCPEDFFRKMQEGFLPEIRFELLSDFRGDDPDFSWLISVSEDGGLVIFDVAYLDETAVRDAAAHLEDLYREWAAVTPNE